MRTATVGILLVMAAIAGCVGSPDKAQHVGGPQGTVNQSFSGPGEGLKPGLGAVDGQVINENGAPLKGAYVAILTTKVSATSGPDGRFAFTDQVPGTYVLRADLKGYVSLEANVEVRTDETTELDVVLVAEGGRSTGFRDHVHDRWGDETSLTLMQVDLRHGPMGPQCNPVGTSISKAEGCWQIPFSLPEGKIVPPGTKELQITIAWTKTDYVKTVDLTWTPANRTGTTKVAGITPGKVISIPVEFPMNDHGHSRFTFWSFLLYAKPLIGGTVAFGQDQWTEEFVGAFTTTIVAVKGPVPSEPAHQRFWANGSRIVLIDQEEHKVTAAPLSRNPTVTACAATLPCYGLAAGKLVPPGATRLLITFEWDWGGALGAVGKGKTLAYRNAERNPSEGSWDNMVYPNPKEAAAKKQVFEIKLKGVELDEFYQPKSLWAFFISHAGEEAAASYIPDCPQQCGGDIFKLTVEVVNDDWTEDLAQGRG